MAAGNPTSREVYLLPLNDDGSPNIPGKEYLYMPAPTDPAYVIRFEIEGTSSVCREGILWVNIPEHGAAFDRHTFRQFKLHPDFNGTLKIDIPVHIAGAFAFHTTYSPLPDFSASTVSPPTPTRTTTYYIDVEPKLTLGSTILPLDALSILSVVSKFMGEYPDDWEKHLRGIGQRDYNMVHFTPLMERGDSNSPYSMYDQLKFDPACFPQGEKDVAIMIARMEKEHGLLGMTDVVWNHTANNSKWLEEHPEAGYNIETAPWLESALELDTALLSFGDELKSYGLPTTLTNLDDLNRVIAGVKAHCITPLKLWQYYVVDVEKDAERAVDAWSQGEISIPEKGFSQDVGGLEGLKDWTLKQKADCLLANRFVGADELGSRFQRSVDAGIAAALLTVIHGRYKADLSEEAAHNTIVDILNELNEPFYQTYDSDVVTIQAQLFDRLKYVRLDEHGPKLGAIGPKSALIESYFTRLPQNETTLKHSPKSLSLVNNGWIWAANALKDHAGSDSRAYLRREVIVWGDCVKLRYGQSPEDNPFLWDFMTKYTRLMAKYFAGFRIDNCHSTPLVVAEYLLDQARQVRPDLAVFAELFTGSEEMDYIFVKRLGLSALIREAMQAWSTQEISRIVHMNGGRPIGSFEVEEVSRNEGAVPVLTEFTQRELSLRQHELLSDLSTGRLSGVNGNKVTQHENVHHIQQSPLHALFMDCTHDNEVPAQKRDARDTLPNAALVNMCACATGSVMGYDEIYPRLLNIVEEKRIYTSASSEGPVKIGGGVGIGGVKKLLNQLHTMMGREGYTESFIHHEGEYITVHRDHPKTRKGYFLIAHTAYPGYGNGHGVLTPVQLAGTKAKLLGSWSLSVDASEQTTNEVCAEEVLLKGLPSKLVDFKGLKIEVKDDETVIAVPRDFPPGSIAMFETWMPDVEHTQGLDSFVTTGARQAFADLDFVDLNFALYRCEPEEQDFLGGNGGVYEIPNYGKLVFAGLQGWWSILRDVIRDNNLGHPICNHLREGQWALDWIVTRLERIAEYKDRPALYKAAEWFKERFAAIRRLPSFLLPRYFALVVQTAYRASCSQAMELFPESIQNAQTFLQSLAMVSIQMTGFSGSASLYPEKSLPCMAAGLPHFTSSWARCWGRDIFVALRGLYLATGRFEIALEHIKSFAAVLKHGMIPNLLGDGKEPRYNSRDSIWFFLQCIQDYVNMAPDGLDILEVKVARRFLPYNDTHFKFDDPRAYSKDSTIQEVIQEALQRHASGLSFREANAGPGLDEQMRDEGFQIDVEVDWSTGLIFGGNQFNCGTWMDKMGSCQKAYNRGYPGTPRDGAAIEITGLAYSTLVWVARLHREGKYKEGHVETSSGHSISFEDWASKIKANFERCYYIPQNPNDDADYEVNSNIVNRRGIYKDLYRSGKEYEDYQLRANFPIAMTVAPDLFTPEKALHALEMADAVLRGPEGMATLDPSDLNYRPYYNNSEDSSDFATSKGRNYHQGPEWLWPTGFFLRALLKFDLMRRNTVHERTEAFQQITRRLQGCKKAIHGSPWAGLAELTQKNGEFCGDSAWSAGCLIDLFYDAQELTRDA
ncbi:glycogen debranching enzyme, partial [Lecanoromycetidae sp. Uapishka_2]